MSGKGKIWTIDEAMNLSRSDSANLFSTYVNPEMADLLKLADMDKRFVKAEGIFLYDEDGNRYMDFTAGSGALNLGHNPPEIIEAVRNAWTLPAVLLAGFNPLMGALGSTLAELLPGELSMTTFGNGGAEAVEIALKTARAYTKRKRFVSCDNAYHGLTFGAMSICNLRKYHEIAGPLLDHCTSIPFGDLDSLENELRKGDVAGFITEPIQGEGGAVAPPKGYLRAAHEICKKYGTLLIADEIQTGFGRTGKIFAIEHEHVVPDIITLSKSLSSGVMPISVSVTTEEIWKKAFGHREKFDTVISTYGGNPAACAAALKSIEIILRDDLAQKCMELGNYSKKRLTELEGKHKLIKEIRGEGLLLGIEVNPPKVGGSILKDNISAMVMTSLANRHGILTSYYDLNPSVLRFEPPLIITKDQIDVSLDSFDAVLSKSLLGLTMSFGKSAIRRKIAG
mgnify:CR=1 FL=1